MLEHIWAKSKPQESLATHTNYVVQNMLNLQQRYFDNIPDPGFWQAAFISALFHDLGKLSENFQDMIQPDRSIERENFIRHEFISGMYLFVNAIDNYKKEPLSLFAVFSHHKPLTTDLFCNRRFIKLRINKQYLDEFEDYAKTWINQYSGLNFSFSKKAKQNLSNEYQVLIRQYEKHCLPIVLGLKPKDRKTYIFYKALLNIADWTASGHRELEPGLSFTPAFLAHQIKEKLLAEGKADIVKIFKFRAFQEASLVKGNVLAIAPTGSGKTEASLLWASQKKEFEHIFYLLPTRVTSNAIFTRLCSYFGKEKVAIVHSSAFFLQKEINESYPEKEYAFIDKAFFKNVTVCTVDQILTQGFNLGFWEVKTFHQLNAKIVIDEIHLYQPYTLGLIIATIQYLQKEFGASFYIMTATMPLALKSLLQKYLNSPAYIADTELLDKARNVFEFLHQSFEEIRNDIVNFFKANAGKNKVLVVLNTVDSAIQAYQYFKHQLPQFQQALLCYHSRFIQKDRSEKERLIFQMEAENEGCILVATQVVEVSLDIDFDTLYSENAPIDAIIQRAGRVNRKRKKEGTKVIVFNHSEVAEKFIYKEHDVLNKTIKALNEVNGQALTEMQLLELVDQVYDDVDIERHPDFLKGIRRYAEIQKEQKYIFDLVSSEEAFTRIGMDTVNVIPDCFQEKLYEESIMEKVKHEVSISRKRFQSLKSVEDTTHKWFKYVDVDYDFETGLKFKKTPSKTNTINL